MASLWSLKFVGRRRLGCCVRNGGAEMRLSSELLRWGRAAVARRSWVWLKIIQDRCFYATPSAAIELWAIKTNLESYFLVLQVDPTRYIALCL